MNDAPHRLIVRGVNWLGDAVMAQPALQRLRAALPHTHLALLTHAKLAELWQHQPEVNEVLTFEKSENIFSVARRIRRGRFDAALILPNSTRSALEMWLARVPVRIGCARTGRNLFLTRALPPRRDEIQMHKRSADDIKRLLAAPPSPPLPWPPAAHHLHHYLHLAAALGANPAPLAPSLVVTDAEIAAIRQRFAPPLHSSPGNLARPGISPSQPTSPVLLNSRGIPSTEGVPLFGLNPGAEYGPAKRWPREHFVAAAVELHRRTQCHWWIFGGPADQALAQGLADDIAAATGQPSAARSLAGQTTLRELCAALKACQVVLTNDTGPMHIAAAVGTPVVVPFGSTSPELTGPGLPGDARHRLLKAAVPCAPCFLRECPIDFRCMKKLDVSRVVEAVLECAAKP